MFGGKNPPPEIITIPQKVKLEDVDFVACGHSYVICKTNYDEIYVWGSNYSGQLGIGNTVVHFVPFKSVNWPSDIVDIKCGTNHTLVLTANQDVYSCGDFHYGKLGTDTPHNYLSLEKMEVSKITRIECGSNHSMCIDENHDLYIFGKNEFGQLGEKDIPYKFIEKHSSLSNIMDISSRGNHTFVKTLDNEIYSFGRIYYSQIGEDTKELVNIRTCKYTPSRAFEEEEYIWFSNITNKSKAKSARSIINPNDT